MNYKSVTVTRRGGPEVLQIVDHDLRPPRAGEVRIRVLATTVGRTDVFYRQGQSALAPKPPFVAGYEMVGQVDTLGRGVSRVAVGDRVAALTGTGSNAEYVYLGQEHLVPVPATLDPAQAVTLVLNYVTAYQMLHRTAKAQVGSRALIVGASGGVGTALLQLGRLADLTLYGLASASKHALVRDLGATPIDYRTQDFVAELQRLEPQGLDLVFDGMGGDYIQRGLAVLRHGGRLVTYAPPVSTSALVKGLASLALLNLRPTGKRVEFYGISALYQADKRPFQTDLPILFNLLAAGQVKPCVAATFPLLEAAKAHTLLDRGEVAGQIVLLARELMP